MSATNAAYFDFRLACQSREHHLVQWSQDLTNWATYQHSLSTLTNRLIQVPMSLGPRAFWRTVLTNEPMFPYALIAKRGINFSNFNVYLDSFDSTNPAHSLNGLYDPMRAQDHGDVAIVGTQTNPLLLDRTVVAGVVHVASNMSITLRYGTVGDQAFVDDPVNAGTIQTNHLLEDAGNLFLPDVEMPSGSEAWTPLPTNGVWTNINGVDYRFVLSSGDYLANALWNQSTFIAGHVRIRADAGIEFTATDQVFIATNGSLQVFANCSNVVFGGNGVLPDTGRAEHFLYFGTARNTSLELGGDSFLIVGAFYAPAATVTLRSNGDPLNPADIVGSIVADTIEFQARHAIHYDEALATQGPMK